MTDEGRQTRELSIGAHGGERRCHAVAVWAVRRATPRTSHTFLTDVPAPHTPPTPHGNGQRSARTAPSPPPARPRMRSALRRAGSLTGGSAPLPLLWLRPAGCGASVCRLTAAAPSASRVRILAVAGRERRGGKGPLPPGEPRPWTSRAWR